MNFEHLFSFILKIPGLQNMTRLLPLAVKRREKPGRKAKCEIIIRLNETMERSSWKSRQNIKVNGDKLKSEYCFNDVKFGPISVKNREIHKIWKFSENLRRKL